EAELLQDALELGLGRRGLQIFDDLGLDAALAQQFERLARFAASGVVIDSNHPLSLPLCREGIRGRPRQPGRARILPAGMDDASLSCRSRLVAALRVALVALALFAAGAGPAPAETPPTPADTGVEDGA